MITEEQQLAEKARELLDEGWISLFLEKIKLDLALEIVETDEMEKREELYQLTKVVKRLNGKLQEYANKIELKEYR